MESACRVDVAGWAHEGWPIARQTVIGPITRKADKTEDLVIIPPGFASAQNRRNASIKFEEAPGLKEARLPSLDRSDAPSKAIKALFIFNGKTKAGLCNRITPVKNELVTLAFNSHPLVRNTLC
jgi:hypothetical protein